MALPRNVLIAGGLALAAVAAAAALLFTHQEADARTQETDDAYVQADVTVVAPQVAGQIAKVLVEENQSVHAGQPLVQIDPRDLQVALQNAKAQVAAALANQANLQAQIERQSSLGHGLQATLHADHATLALAQANRDRYANLAQDGSGSVQARQQAEAQWQTAQAGIERDSAALDANTQQTAVLKTELERAKAAVDAAKAQQAAAELNLSYAAIQAPGEGIVAQRTARTGAIVNKGQPLLTIVPVQAAFIEAHYRETQLAHVAVGQAVSFTVDALPGVTFKGHVASLGPASGASLAPLAAHNATGNFTKIVQRLPVRISIDPGQAAQAQLRIGMSVKTSISTNAGRS